MTTPEGETLTRYGCALTSGRHYEVVSMVYSTGGYGWYDPPESGVDWAMVPASTAKEAIAKAAKLDEFKGSVRVNRGDGLPPWAGMKAHRATCDHGNCWGCGECATCVSESAVTNREENR